MVAAGGAVAAEPGVERPARGGAHQRAREQAQAEGEAAAAVARHGPD